MAIHNNPSITQRINRIFNFKAGDTLSSEVTGVIANVPIETTSDIVVQGNITSGTGTATILTTPSNKDFYLDGISLTIATDATATLTQCRINAFIDGVSTRIHAINRITLTATNQTSPIVFSKPIKLSRGSAITLFVDTVVANYFAQATIYGHVEEVTKDQ